MNCYKRCIVDREEMVMIHKGTKTIETERLILRPFRESDVEPMFRNWASDPEVTKFMTWPVHESVAVTCGGSLDERL